MFELGTLLTNIFLLALFVLVVQPYLSIAYKESTESQELRETHKKTLLQLLVSWVVTSLLFGIAIYTSSKYLPIFITPVLLYMYFLTIRGIMTYRKHKKPKEKKLSEKIAETVTTEETVAE